KKNEDGIINSKYPLKETETLDPKERTELNVHNADTTLIILLLTSDPGLDSTAFTIEMVKKHKKPYEIIYLKKNALEDNIEQMLYWIKKNKIKHLNVAGPRESNSLGIQNPAHEFMYSLLEKMTNDNIKAKL
ncbi:24664_t:CDS:1, partial [Gigaspora margarita]